MIAMVRTETFHLFGNLLHLIAPSDSNTGKVSIVECRTKPGAGAPPNRHSGDDECFYVLSGQYEFVIDGVCETKGAGSLVRVPNNARHLFTNKGMTEASMLIITWPGQGHDDFFRKAGEPVAKGTKTFPEAKGPPDVAAMKSLAQECGIELMI
jgi:mannose-6-phosphate isomerase-like protein (cupin superfamily)